MRLYRWPNVFTHVHAYTTTHVAIQGEKWGHDFAANRKEANKRHYERNKVRDQGGGGMDVEVFMQAHMFIAFAPDPITLLIVCVAQSWRKG